jgi:hypothetical protein
MLGSWWAMPLWQSMQVREAARSLGGEQGRNKTGQGRQRDQFVKAHVRKFGRWLVAFPVPAHRGATGGKHG